MPKTLFIMLFFLVSWPLLSRASSMLEQPCGIETCQGLEITCGPKVPRMCTAMYRLGDFCRNYVRCEIVEGECHLIMDERFLSCKACMEECSSGTDPMAALDCETACRKAIEQKDSPVQQDDPNSETVPTKI